MLDVDTLCRWEFINVLQERNHRNKTKCRFNESLCHTEFQGPTSSDSVLTLTSEVLILVLFIAVNKKCKRGEASCAMITIPSSTTFNQIKREHRHRSLCYHIFVDRARLRLRTAATNGYIVLSPDDIYMSMKPWWNDDTDRGNRRTYPSATLSTTNPTWTDPGANPCLRCRWQTTNRPCDTKNISCLVRSWK
jgi:hypothetical protein